MRIPTSSSWLNLIERWFGELTSKRIRRDSFLSVDDLIAAINEFLAAWNEKPRPLSGRPPLNPSWLNSPLPSDSRADPARLHGSEPANEKAS